WTYHELGFEAVSGGLIYVGAALPLEPPGFNDTLSVSDIGPDSVMLHWKNRDMIGDELIEVWLRPAGGAWALATSVGVSAAVDQQYLLEGLDAGTDYDWALRAVRGGLYRAGYESPDPDTWPAASRSSFTTLLLPPTIESATWERTSASSERILVTVSPVYNDVDLELLSGGVVVGTAPAPHSGPVTIAHVDPAGEQLHTYTARHRTAAKEGDESAPVSRWAGPDAPTLTEIIPQGVCVYTVRWASASGSLYTEIEDDYPNSSFALRGTAAPGQGEIQVAHGQAIEDCAGIGGEMIPVTVRIRHRQDSFGVSDYSHYSIDGLELCNACSFNGGNG